MAMFAVYKADGTLITKARADAMEMVSDENCSYIQLTTGEDVTGICFVADGQLVVKES